jgi:hypothetical protein
VDRATLFNPDICAGDQRASNFAFLWKPIKSQPERTLLVLAFLALTAICFPNVLLQRRFWAEEGLVFYANAWSLSWWEALLFPSQGYINAVPNIAGLLAYLVPIEAALYVTSGVALAVHCLPAFLVTFARDAWLQSRGAVIAALVLIATPPGTEEACDLDAIHRCPRLLLALGAYFRTWPKLA